MKLWNTYDPRLKRSLQILIWSTVGVFGAYIVLSVVLAVVTEPGFFDGWFTLLMMGVIGLVLTPIVLAVANFVRYLLLAKYSRPTPELALDKLLSGVAAASGLLALALYLLDFLWEHNFKYPWNDLSISSQIGAFGSVALIICVAALVLNFAANHTLRFLRKHYGEAGKDSGCRLVRRASMICLGVFLVGFLLIPAPQGTYNDGGSRFYKAVLYEVIDWNRAPAEGAMEIPDDFDPNEDQKTRLYFFPFNCYTYEAKWDMKH
ncbi:MAG: hypothetical protein E7610_07315 [Ruminococcaceae bacterium]|nr:hypothetical protein [Oscillospiraceae bacterium]